MQAPPYYILFSAEPANSLGHPIIQYQYADDSPLALLPQREEHVLLLEYDEDSSVTVTSISTTLIVTGVKAEEAPGAAVADNKRNDKMYIIEATTAASNEDKPYPPNERPSPQAVVAQFKRRNLVIREALSYPEGKGLNFTAPATSQ